MSVDPLARAFPWNSPYAFAENDVTRSIDLDGLEKEFIIDRLYNLDGRNKDMPIGLYKHEAYSPLRNNERVPIINSTSESLDHYFKGQGELVVLGDDVLEVLRNSDRVNQARNNLATGTTTAPASGGVLTVDVTWEDNTFFVGRTGLSYQTICAGNTCTTTFTIDDEGFVDPNFLIAWLTADNEGPNAELPKSEPYDFQPVIWEETYENPGYPVDENGIPSPIPLNNQDDDEG